MCITPWFRFWSELYDSVTNIDCILTLFRAFVVFVFTISIFTKEGLKPNTG